jgi:hypothetical protein
LQSGSIAAQKSLRNSACQNTVTSHVIMYRQIGHRLSCRAKKSLKMVLSKKPNTPAFHANMHQYTIRGVSCRTKILKNISMWQHTHAHTHTRVTYNYAPISRSRRASPHKRLHPLLWRVRRPQMQWQKRCTSLLFPPWVLARLSLRLMVRRICMGMYMYVCM